VLDPQCSILDPQFAVALPVPEVRQQAAQTADL
jgi:hypothetical protein